MTLARISCASHIFKSRAFFIAALLVVTLSAVDDGFSKSDSEILLQISGKTIEMIQVPEKRLMISKNCQKQSDFSCQAYTVFEETKKSSPSKSKTPPEVGMQICVQANGSVKIATTPSKDEITLCYFSKDQSYIDLGSLYARTRGF